MNYLDLGFNNIGIKTITTTEKKTAQEIRNEFQFGSIAASSVFIGSGDNVFKADKDGISLGNAVFDLAPFRVDMKGNASLQSADITVTQAVIQPGEDQPAAFTIKQADGTQVFQVDTTNGWINVGPDQPSYNLDPLVPLYVTKSVDSYMAVNIQNPNDGTSASTDFGCLNDIPYATTSLGGLIDLGITSSNFADPNYAVYGADTAYLWAGDTEDLYLGTAKPTGSIQFFTGGVDSTDYRNVEINSNGVLIPKKVTEENEPPYVEGGIYYNTTKKKMYIGGDTGWEELTSVVVPSASASPSVSPSISKSPSVSPSVSPSEP